MTRITLAILLETARRILAEKGREARSGQIEFVFGPIYPRAVAVDEAFQRPDGGEVVVALNHDGYAVSITFDYVPSGPPPTENEYPVLDWSSFLRRVVPQDEQSAPLLVVLGDVPIVEQTRIRCVNGGQLELGFGESRLVAYCLIENISSNT